jgi:hypothetical protein
MTVPMTRGILLVVLLVCSAGCLGANEEPLDLQAQSGAVDEVIADREPRVQTWEGGVTAVGGCSDATGANMVGSFDLGQELDVFGNVTALLVEVSWEPTVMDLCLSLRSPGNQYNHFVPPLGSPGTGSLRILMEDPMEGVWSAMVISQGISHAEYRAASTVFYGEVPSDYTALA